MQQRWQFSEIIGVYKMAIRIQVMSDTYLSSKYLNTWFNGLGRHAYYTRVKKRVDYTNPTNYGKILTTPSIPHRLLLELSPNLVRTLVDLLLALHRIEKKHVVDHVWFSPCDGRDARHANN